jgi:hypothetical protein
MPLPTGSIEFVAFHQPALPDGDYVLDVTQQVKIDGKFVWSNDAAPRAQLKFSVNGPRFSLDPDLIQSQFPPPKSIGEYYNVLPHIILNRTTLPWERTIDNSAPGTSDLPKPWMALLLFDASADKGAPVVTNITVQDLLDTYGESGTPSGKPQFVKVLPRDPSGHAGVGELMLEVGQHPGDRLTVIDVPWQLLIEILPGSDEIAFLSHVRQAVDPTDATKVSEYPVIMCNRLPGAGTGAGTVVGTQSTVHLVSLEARQSLFDTLQTNTPGDTLVRFVSLASWSFSTLQRNKTFTAWLKSAWCPDAQGDNCAADVIHTLRLPTSADTNAERFLAQGYAPIKHQTRQGNHLVSWYRGPCLPGTSPAADIALPVRTSDELVRYLSDLAMFDTSYAAAWELGRLLTLRSKKVSVSLFKWKRAYAQQLKQAKHAATHLPFAPDHSIAPDFPEPVSDWFTDLLRLKHVPFHYLVPREDMLPANSLRFFNVDVNWLECLLDGAFSIGRVTSADITQDGEARKAGMVPNAATSSGFLLRSPVVSGWPNLEVEAYTQAIPGDDYLPAGITPAKRLRFDRLGEDVLLCLFEGELKTVDIHEHAETIHFGVDAGSDPSITGDYTKKLRNLTDYSPGNSTPLTWKSSDKRTLNIHDLVVKGHANNSAEFGVTMIEGVEKVRFVKST